MLVTGACSNPTSDAAEGPVESDQGPGEGGGDDARQALRLHHAAEVALPAREGRLPAGLGGEGRRNGEAGEPRESRASRSQVGVDTRCAIVAQVVHKSASILSLHNRYRDEMFATIDENMLVFVVCMK